MSNELAVFSPVRGKTGSLNRQDHLNQVYCNLSGIFALSDELDFQVAFVNLKTARALGIKIPSELMLQATKVIK